MKREQHVQRQEVINRIKVVWYCCSLKCRQGEQKNRIGEWMAVKSYRALWTSLGGEGTGGTCQKLGDANVGCHSHLGDR